MGGAVSIGGCGPVLIVKERGKGMEIAIVVVLYFVINRLVKRRLKRSYDKSAELRRENLLRRRALESTGHTVVVNATNGKILSCFKNTGTPAGSERPAGIGDI